MRVLVLLVCLVGLSFSVNGAELRRSASCGDSDFIAHGWQFIKRSEPALAEMVTDIGKHVGVKGNKVKMTNCWVEWPVDRDGKSVNGMRTVVMDRTWFVDGSKHHAGMYIRYYKSQKQVGAETEIYRSVTGYKLCRSPRVCKEFDIPFADKKPTEAVASLDAF